MLFEPQAILKQFGMSTCSFNYDEYQLFSDWLISHNSRGRMIFISASIEEQRYHGAFMISCPQLESQFILIKEKTNLPYCFTRRYTIGTLTFNSSSWKIGAKTHNFQQAMQRVSKVFSMCGI
ncbi:hypothetical protein [Celerinatantimonas sp. YJH-8]|uniref:hypothetical protein n=1 Tax=Celerinatantimonas sp. YJH-8 TaxID=3228714 RepID=UPI0038C6CF2B